MTGRVGGGKQRTGQAMGRQRGDQHKEEKMLEGEDVNASFSSCISQAGLQ